MDNDERVVYRRVNTTSLKCDLGCEHRAYVYARKHLRITHRVRTPIFYGDIPQGTGVTLYALDYQGRSYRKAPHWDGPRASNWQRADGHHFTEYPDGEVRLNLDGSVIPR
jgi:hypothetical protein